MRWLLLPVNIFEVNPITAGAMAFKAPGYRRVNPITAGAMAFAALGYSHVILSPPPSWLLRLVTLTACSLSPPMRRFRTRANIFLRGPYHRQCASFFAREYLRGEPHHRRSDGFCGPRISPREPYHRRSGGFAALGYRHLIPASPPRWLLRLVTIPACRLSPPMLWFRTRANIFPCGPYHRQCASFFAREYLRGEPYHRRGDGF